jgi:hypothetical protein
VAGGPPPLGSVRRAHEIEFKIVGSEMQFVEVDLDPAKAPWPKPGA